MRKLWENNKCLIGRTHQRWTGPEGDDVTPPSLPIKDWNISFFQVHSWVCFVFLRKVVGAISGKQKDAQVILSLNYVVSQPVSKELYRESTVKSFYSHDSRLLHFWKVHRSYLIINHILKFLTEYLNENYGNYSTERMKGIKLKMLVEVTSQWMNKPLRTDKGKTKEAGALGSTMLSDHTYTL